MPNYRTVIKIGYGANFNTRFYCVNVVMFHAIVFVWEGAFTYMPNIVVINTSYCYIRLEASGMSHPWC